MDSSHGGTPDLQDQHRARASIHDVPVELLSPIIYLSIQGYSTHLKRVQTLCFVCSKWRDVVEDTPELWCRLTSADPLEGVRKAIHYSRDHPLDIDYHCISRTRSNPPDFLQAVAPHVWRCRQASIIVDRSTQRMLQALTVGEAPRLESLAIVADGLMNPWFYTREPLTLFQGATLPSLRSLRIRDIPLVWNGEQLFNLQRLEIVAPERTLVPLIGLLSVLRVTQRLEEFTCLASFSQALEGDRITAPLPALKKLSIHSFGTSSWLDLFSMIRAPACRYLSLGGDFSRHLENPNNLAQIAEGISQIFPRVWKATDREERVRIAVGCWEVRLSSSTLQLVFSGYPQTIQLAKWTILNLVDELEEINLSINDYTWNASQLEMLDLPTLGRKVSKLDINADVRERRAILEYLSSPDRGSDSQTRWPLPDLTEVALAVTADDLPGILRMLRGRAQAIDLPGSLRPQGIIGLHLSEDARHSLDITDILAEIDSLLRGNGGSLTIMRWGAHRE
ncbi:hypothetical protein M407DRAFT_28092 [Tulasnella calospora MUT 4182]|uniref:F-box domain-containing protein n=1 Tax=Tulasnella calospora MUT 4182 TaxID=1051891 RepID=A0A0C3KM08_9AGAM|nr:hypothetical protein M407DRAFT_28092 [Tulasnella calospora MUT 4182]